MENQSMPTVLITGGTGAVGKSMTALLTSKGYQVIILTRHAAGRTALPGVSYKEWNVKKGQIDQQAVAAADYLIHLAGAGVAESRWTKERKAEIVTSRTESSALLIKAVQASPNRLKAVISASAIGWYGPDGQRITSEGFEENAPAAPGFLGDTCRLWEASVAPFEHMGKRLSILRIGLVLMKEGGVLPALEKPMKYGLAAILGSGEQVMSWIHVHDLCRLFLYALENETMRGVYNAVAPTPVAHKTIVLNLANRLRGKTYTSMHVPAFALKLMLGEMSIEVLKSATVSAAKIKAAGFTFGYPSIDAALEQLTKK